MFKITKILTDDNGDSFFEEETVPLSNAGEIGRLSKKIPAGNIIFREVDALYDWDFHNAPQKQFILLLDGEIEIETSLGEKRYFKAGDVILAEDVTGKGHKTKNIGHTVRRSVFITLRD